MLAAEDTTQFVVLAGLNAAVLRTDEPNSPDPHAHHNDIKSLIKIVRSYLGVGRSGIPLVGASQLAIRLIEFQTQLPIMAHRAGIGADEIDVFKAFNDYMYFLSLYLKEYPAI